MKVGVIYTKFYPLSSSASVHGFHLFNSLKESGAELHSFGLGSNSLTIDHPRSLTGLISFIRAIDLIYIRINPWLWNDWFSLVKLVTFGRVKVVWEINAPVEEILADYHPSIPSKIRRKVQVQNFKRKMLAKLCNGSISVSTVLKEYAHNYLKIKRSVCIANASDPQLFKRAGIAPTNPLAAFVKDKFVVAWAGNGAIVWQGTNLLMELAKHYAVKDVDIQFVVFSNKSVYNQAILPNVLSLGEVNHQQLPELLQVGHMGFCLYNEYDWCKYGFYNSPLKLYDYLSLEMIVIATNTGQMSEVIENGVNGLLVNNNLQEIIEKIDYCKRNYDEMAFIRDNARQTIVDKYNWKSVGEETRRFLSTMVK